MDFQYESNCKIFLDNYREKSDASNDVAAKNTVFPAEITSFLNAEDVSHLARSLGLEAVDFLSFSLKVRLKIGEESEKSKDISESAV